MRTENSRKAARVVAPKPVKQPKPKVVKATPAKKVAARFLKPIEPETADTYRFRVSPVSLATCVGQLSDEEISQPKNIALIYSLFILGEVSACSNPTLRAMTDTTVEMTAELQGEVYRERPNLKKCSSLALRICDSIEMHNCEDESKLGNAIRRLRELESVIVQRKLKVRADDLSTSGQDNLAAEETDERLMER
jgi:hypothetical protein